MERKLKEYRAKQERLNKVQRFRERLRTIFSFKLPFSHKKDIKDEERIVCDNKKSEKPSRSSYLKKRKVAMEEVESLIRSEDSISIDESLMDDSIWCCTWLQIFYYFLYFILWGIIYVIFIQLQFGTVYFVVSALLFMYFNTGTSPRRSGEMSAYSVFNKDCASIDGTLKAEQFEREIMYGPGSVR